MSIDFEKKHVSIVQEPHSLEPLGDKPASEVLEIACDVLEELEIKHWLSDGTILGLYRDNCLMAHDSDLDVDVYFDSFEQAAERINLLKSELYDCRHHDGPVFDAVRQMVMEDGVMQIVFLERRENIILDIHVYYPQLTEDEEGDKMYTYSEHGALWYPKEMFESLERLEFDGYEYPVANPEKYLSLRYGAEWGTPKAEKDYDWTSEAGNLIRRPPSEHALLTPPPYRDIHKSTINSYLKEYEGIHEGKTGIVFATGPTLADYKPVPEHDDAIKIGVNRVFNSEKCSSDLDYYFFGSEYELDSEYKQMVDEFCSKNPDLTKFASVFRHGQPIDPRFGNVSIRNAALLGAFPFESNHHVISKDISKNSFVGFSIAFPAFQFMLYTGVEKIYLVGCDLVDTSDHFDGKYSKLGTPEAPSDEARIWRVIWDSLNSFTKQHYPDVEIEVVNPVGLKGIFNGTST